MRRAPSFLAASAAFVFAAAGCGSSSGPSGGAASRPPEQHHLPPAPVLPDATPYDGVTFENPGVNPYVDPTTDRESTFALDVDTGSYTIARRFITDGNRPDPDSIRVEEFVNAFDQGYEPPASGTFAIHADGGPTPFLPRDEVLLRIGIRARDIAEHRRRDAALTFVIDVSGSMAREDRLELVKRALGLLVDELRDEDTVAIVVYGSDARVVLEPTPAGESRAIREAIDRLQPEGSTNAEAGLRLGYELARENLVEGGINRVILASDGVANVGLTDADGILRRIADEPMPGSSSSPSASGWATTTTPCSSSSPTAGTGSTRTSTTLTRPAACSSRI